MYLTIIKTYAEDTFDKNEYAVLKNKWERFLGQGFMDKKAQLFDTTDIAVMAYSNNIHCQFTT